MTVFEVGTLHSFGQLDFSPDGALIFKLDCAMVWWLYFLFHTWCSTRFRKREPALQFSPNLYVVQRSERGPSKSGWGDGNPAASDTSQAGLATALGVGDRQAGSWVGSWGRIWRMRWGICFFLQLGVCGCEGGHWSWALLIPCIWSLAGSGLCRGSVVGLSPGLLSTKASKFCFQPEASRGKSCKPCTVTNKLRDLGPFLYLSVSQFPLLQKG